MVTLTCKNHTHLVWRCKKQAITNGRYNGQRKIFFCGNRQGRLWDENGVIEECECPPEDLQIEEEGKE